MEFWTLTKRSRCYNCSKLADQIIEIYPNQAFVKCSNCGATRCYIIKNVYIDNNNVIECEKDKKLLYDNWLLEKEAECYNCKRYAIQDILITVAGMYVRCRNCRFTRYYRFNIIYISEK
ncbi:hypothetical protein [Methanofervidicoccus abyssi]|uniref:Uncharacterized protein n=1 Tax=Methanofervidicoccus abyssi TaxID=2082189 RepID=A0A401HRF2_9EURY|nr:hypothetical protein [Methanofervidicoccus abyssi]GBF36847.1 hypothetical protein MHHB_P1077 [Methanofervidicoccus abyssi]